MPDCYKIYDNQTGLWISSIGEITSPSPEVTYATSEATAHCYTLADYNNFVSQLNEATTAGRFGRPKDRQH